MKVVFRFDENKVRELGYTKRDAYYTVKEMFAEKKLPCVSEDEVLSFKDCGRSSDYAGMWLVILNLLKSEWFIKCATSCVFYNDEGDEEDVLSQAWKVRKD